MTTDPPPLKKRYTLPWTRVMMFGYCAGCAVVGVFGFDNSQSSPAIQGQLGGSAVWLYSAILVVSGVIGCIGIFRNLKATVFSVWGIAAATFFHGAAIIGADGSGQTGLRLLVSPLMMIPAVWAWRQWLIVVRLPPGSNK